MDAPTDSPPSTPAVAPPLPPAPRPGEPEAIFVVGAHRSGTTLMRTLLELSDRIGIARENHFVGHLRRTEGARYYFRRAGDLKDDGTIRRIVAMIYDGDFQRQSRLREVSPLWRWLPENFPREEMERRLLAAERTERGMFAAFIRTHADYLGRPVMGEKTPAHIAYVDTLLEWFPDGRVIHMVRDPRAVFVSDLRRRRGRLVRPYSWLAVVPGLLALTLLVQDTIVWRDAERLHRIYQKRYPDRYRLVHFEDLVREPLPTLRGLYEFLGVEMPADPTRAKVVSHGYRAGETGLDADAADRWREQIGRFSKRWLEFFLSAPMRRMGYSR